ncbi:hypothetical protein VP01_1945g1 [Puccinia sorghi]|uniref:Uncharacterized protein n=1 Tax=Puccinia sorghi TaxID=27349 RepID=A0A0L6VCD5_9BASI|nr:hypothetical protein VP01_1945g1 [Puccinia sorghi]
MWGTTAGYFHGADYIKRLLIRSVLPPAAATTENPNSHLFRLLLKMAESTRAPALASATLSPAAGFVYPAQADQPSQSGFSPLKQYNGAIYKWTQQLLMHTQNGQQHTNQLASMMKNSSISKLDSPSPADSPSSKFA